MGHTGDLVKGLSGMYEYACRYGQEEAAELAEEKLYPLISLRGKFRFGEEKLSGDPVPASLSGKDFEGWLIDRYLLDPQMRGQMFTKLDQLEESRWYDTFLLHWARWQLFWHCLSRGKSRRAFRWNG
mgnify:CR=1 FL=1